MAHALHHAREAQDLNAVGGHCPRCGAEYRPGFDTCSDCSVPLLPGPARGSQAIPQGVDAWAEANARVWGDKTAQGKPEPEVRPDELASAAELPWEEAWLLAGRLRADGIPAVVYPDDYTGYNYWSPRRFQVIVRADRLAEAKQVAARFTP